MPQKPEHDNLHLSVRATKNGFIASIVSYQGCLGADHVGIVSDDYVAITQSELVDLVTKEVSSRIVVMCADERGDEQSCAG